MRFPGFHGKRLTASRLPAGASLWLLRGLASCCRPPALSSVVHDRRWAGMDHTHPEIGRHVMNRLLRRWRQARFLMLIAALAAAVIGTSIVSAPAHAAGTYRSNSPIVGVASTPDGGGYWQVAADGGVFAFGDAGFYGSMGGRRLNAPVVGMAATGDGRGYWLAAADGGVFAFGDARFYGSMVGRPMSNPVTAITSSPDSKGYLLAGGDGGVFAFGDARFHGSMGGKSLVGAVDGITNTPGGGGYWLVAVDGGIFAFGDAFYDGRAGYTPPAPSSSAAGQRAADLAIGWIRKDYHGINDDYWHAFNPPEYWCSDFATYVWQSAGVIVPTYPGVGSFAAWARQHGRFSTDTVHLQIGDVIFYPQHVGVIVQVSADGSVTTADGDWGGTVAQKGTPARKAESIFASSSHVIEHTFDPRYGDGPAGVIVGIGLIR
jgi:hypothetical protein